MMVFSRLLSHRTQQIEKHWADVGNTSLTHCFTNVQTCQILAPTTDYGKPEKERKLLPGISYLHTA